MTVEKRHGAPKMRRSVKLIAAGMAIAPFPLADTVAGGPSIAFDVDDLTFQLPSAIPSTQQVRVYTGPSCTGVERCFSPGTTVTSLVPEWNDRIASIRVRGSGRVFVCLSPHLSGPCTVFPSSQPILRGPFHHAISSLRTI